MSGLLASTTGLSFRSPWLLLVALAVPIALWIRRRRGDPAVAFAPTSLVGVGRASRTDADGALPRSWRVALLPLPRVLAVLGILAAIVAAARPVRSEPLPLESEGIDIVLCIDTSSSMRANDMADMVDIADATAARTRIEVARATATEFVRSRPRDRIGLVTFARFPDVRCPLTLDHDALEKIVAEVATVVGDGPEDATGIGAAVARAAASLEHSAAKSKVVVLLTDGEENVATKTAPGEIAPSHAAQLCERLGVRVYGIAVGSGKTTAGARQPLDTSALERLASKTGGQFFHATDAAATAAAYERIDDLETTVFHAQRFVEVDQFLPWLLAAIALLVAGRLLSATALAVLP